MPQVGREWGNEEKDQLHRAQGVGIPYDEGFLGFSIFFENTFPKRSAFPACERETDGPCVCLGVLSIGFETGAGMCR